MSDTWVRVILTEVKGKARHFPARFSKISTTWAPSTDLPEHLSGRKEPNVGGHGQRKAISQPVELRWGRACGNTFHVDWTVQHCGQLLDRVTVAIYHRRDWRARLKQTFHAFIRDKWLYLTDMDTSSSLEINQKTHRKHSDWISCPLLLQGWWPHRCTCQYHWFELQSMWAYCHLSWSWAKAELHHNNILTLQRHFILFLLSKHYLSPMLLVSLMTAPSFNHCRVGFGVPLARQTSWMLSFSRTPISLGRSDPVILGGTNSISGLSTLLWTLWQAIKW